MSEYKGQFNTGNSGQGPHYTHQRTIHAQKDDYVNIGGARVKNTPEDRLKHVQKTFPNVKEINERNEPKF